MRRELVANLGHQPYGWRAPAPNPIVLGTKRNRHGRVVPNVRVALRPIEVQTAYIDFAVPVLAQALGMGAGVLRGPVGIRVFALGPRPRSDHRVRSAIPRERCVVKPDLTNIVKIVEDCCTRAGWWEDDCQVAFQMSEKWTQAVPAHRCPRDVRCDEGEPPRVQIIAWELEDHS